MHKRIISVGLGVAACASLGFCVPAGATPTPIHVWPGSQYTLETGAFQDGSDTNGCEVVTFSATSLTANRYGDTGSWHGGGQTINMTWHHGADAGIVFHGQWSAANDRYEGRSTSGEQLWIGLFPGASLRCTSH